MSQHTPSPSGSAPADHGGPLQHKTQLDALRGIACLLVLIAHLRSVWVLNWIPEIIGVFGVGMFFSLSGFLITRILLAARGKPNSLANFYNRRVARIFPIYYLTLIALWLTWPGESLGWAAAFTFNLRYLATARDYFMVDAAKTAIPPIAHFWSLCVEEHFYWVWPFVVLFLPRAAFRRIPFLIVTLTPLACWILADRLLAFSFTRDQVEGLLSRLTFTQLTAISIGSWAAINEGWLTERWNDWGNSKLSRSAVCGTLLLLGGAVGHVIVTQWHPSPKQELLLLATRSLWLHLACGGLFLWVLALPSLGSQQLLCRAGAVSYGAYLYHLPIYAGLGLVSQNASATVGTGILAFGLTLIVALLSFHLLEAPLLRRVRQSKPDQSRIARYLQPVGMALTIAVAAAAFWNLTTGYLALTPNADRYATVSPENVEMLIVGSSHAETAIATPHLVDSAYNLAFNSQDLWYDCHIVRSSLDRLPKIERVIFSVSVFSFRRNVARIENQRWMESMYYHTWGIPSYDANPIHNYNVLALAGSEHDVERMARKSVFAEEPYRGWNAKRDSNIDPRVGEKRARLHARHGEAQIGTNLTLLIETIHVCQRHGITPYLVTTPLHRTYRDHIPHSQLTQFLENVAHVQQLTGVRYWDFSEDPRFLSSDFFDPDHLNENGAVKFTRLLNEQLNDTLISTANPADASSNANPLVFAGEP